MNQVFADANYWVALINRGDSLHEKALELSKTLAKVRIFTSQFIIIEVLNFFSSRGAFLRKKAVKAVDNIVKNPNNVTVMLSNFLYLRALRLYRTRQDKQWSFVDCSSFIIMEDNEIREALTGDFHFQEAGFHALLS